MRSAWVAGRRTRTALGAWQERTPWPWRSTVVLATKWPPALAPAWPSRMGSNSAASATPGPPPTRAGGAPGAAGRAGYRAGPGDSGDSDRGRHHGPVASFERLILPGKLASPLALDGARDALDKVALQSQEDSDDRHQRDGRAGGHAGPVSGILGYKGEHAHAQRAQFWLAQGEHERQEKGVPGPHKAHDHRGGQDWLCKGQHHGPKDAHKAAPVNARSVL